ncbi:hypothetical protein GCM10027059_45700 [Myceligenerans halotolerans]
MVLNRRQVFTLRTKNALDLSRHGIYDDELEISFHGAHRRVRKEGKKSSVVRPYWLFESTRRRIE